MVDKSNTNTVVYNYIDLLLDDPEAKDAPLTELTKVESTDEVRIDCLVATIGRYRLLIDSKCIVDVKPLEEIVDSRNGLLEGIKLFDLRSQLQGHQWKQFPEVKQGYMIALNEENWAVYFESVSDTHLLSLDELKKSSLSKKHQWIEGVIMDPLRIFINVNKLIEFIHSGDCNSINL